MKLVIDSTSGGNGDVWMRLVSFYTIAGIEPKYSFEIIVPSFFKQLAEYSFGDRLVILTGKQKSNLKFTSLGIRDLIGGILSGQKYIAPYYRAVIHDKKKIGLKDKINTMIFSVFDLLGLIQVPHNKWIKVYQGYLDVIGIKKLRHISYENYISQLEIDYTLIYRKLNQDIPVSPELEMPVDLHQNVVIFPTGTSRQFIPVWWAKENLPNAYYAFFIKDKDAQPFVEAGLKVIYFFKEPGDIIALSHKAKSTISTDSFPSHLLQYATKNCTITITEVLKSRIISPVFKGDVVDNQVSCHPCLHINKSKFCAAGFMECLNWKNKNYTQNILNYTKD
jgi:hypothetical protein